MLRLRNLRNKYQKRTLRQVYGHTQATPHACTLDPTLRDSDGDFRRPLAADTVAGGYPLDRTASAYVLKNGLVPGTVVVRNSGEEVAVANGENLAAIKPFGLLANFVGGDLDEVGDEDYVGVWRGTDSVFEVLAPAFDDTGLSAAYAAANAEAGPVSLYAGADGRLKYEGTPGNRVAVAELIERVSASRIIVKLKV